MRRFCLPGFLIATLVMFCSCSSDGGSAAVACLTTADCPVGQICTDGACGSGVPVDTDGDGGEVPLTVECQMDYHCDPGYVCLGNICIPDDLPNPDGDAPPDGDDPDGDNIVDGDKTVDGDEGDGDEAITDGDMEGIVCKDHLDCDDGLYCTGNEICGENLRCEYGTPPCNDGVACTEDLCDEASKSCTFEADHPACDDEDTCNGSEYCDPAVGCKSRDPLDCDDGIPCTADDCQAETGCVHEADDLQCDDEVACTVNTCDPNVGCVFSPDNSNCDDGLNCTSETCNLTEGCIIAPSDLACDDGFSCTVDRCLLAVGCENSADNGQCDAEDYCNPDAPGVDPGSGCAPRPQCSTDPECNDGNWCNGVETCVDLQCLPGQSENCDDQIGCTEDRCDDGINQCVNTPVDSACSDGNTCNGLEHCDGQLDCLAGQPLNCNDAVDCTTDSCDPASGCQNRPVDSSCNDGVACTVDLCNATTGCQHQPDNTFCDDLVPCTVDVCDVISACSHIPNHDYCDDGFACTSDTCTVQYNCVHESHNDQCNDQVSCTIDTCQVGVGCNYSPDDNLCQTDYICDALTGCRERPQCVIDADCTDSNLCNGAEVCGDDGRCSNGEPLSCNDSISCTIDSCDPAQGCVHTLDHQVCDDGSECTGDICIEATGCYHEVMKDTDNDYYIDDACAGGNDCNDGVPEINPGAEEDCEDDIDNNCDGLTDEEEAICQPCIDGCPAGMDCCNGSCIDILYDNNNCNGCGKFCATACYKGECLPAGKCADALNNLITQNVTYNNESSCGYGHHYNSRNECPSATWNCDGEDRIYAIKPIHNNDMRVYAYPKGSNSDDGTVYLLDDCRVPSSCTDYDWATETLATLYVTPDKDNNGEIFFAVVDTTNGCLPFDFKVDYDYEPSDCESTGKSHQATFALVLAVLIICLLKGGRRRRRS